MKTIIYRKGVISATLLLILGAMVNPSFAEETATATVTPEKKDRVFKYNRRAQIRPVDMGLDAPKDRYKVDRPSMDRLAEEPKEGSIFKSEQQMVVPQSLMPQTQPNRKLDPKENEGKNWLTPATWSDEDEGGGSNRSVFEQEYDERKKAEDAERSPWDSEEEETSEGERDEERYKREDEQDEDSRYSISKNAIDDEGGTEKRLGMLEFKPALERNLYSMEDRDNDRRPGEGEGSGRDEQRSRMDRRQEAAAEGDEDRGFSRAAMAMGLDRQDGLGANKSQKMMSEITEKWLGTGTAEAMNVPKLEDLMKTPSMSGVAARAPNPSPASQSGDVGIRGYKPERISSTGGVNLPSARISPAGFSSSSFSPSISRPSLSGAGTGGFAGQSSGASLGGAGFSASSVSLGSQGFQPTRQGTSSSSFGSPYGGSAGTTATEAPRRMQSEMGLGGFKVPKF